LSFAVALKSIVSDSSERIDIELTLNMKKVMMITPILTLFVNIAILLDIPILREIIVFVFLSVVPGFALLRLFKLKEISFLDTILFSVALSIASVMLMGLLVNELYLFLGFSQSLSTIPLTVAISVFTLTVFLVECRRDLPEALKLKTNADGEPKNVFPLSIILFLLPPLLSVLGVLYFNVYVILLSCAIVAGLCVMSVVSRKLVPQNLFPFLIFSISIALICQVLLTSKYIMGWDANLEYYVFRLTQINGHWGFLNANFNELQGLNFDHMLSITLLPAVYSALMHAQGEIVFKILYPFLSCLIPLTLYRISEKQFGKLIALLSALFLVFSNTAFYGAEPLNTNRQIVGELFLLLSVFLLISKSIPVTKRRGLLIIFGAALAVSHYSLAYIYLGIVAILFIISKVKSRSDDILNGATVSLLFVVTFLWCALGTSSPLVSLVGNIRGAFVELALPREGTALDIGVPQVFTVATWTNLLLSGVANLFLIIGFLSIMARVRDKKKGISVQFTVILTMAGVMLAVALVVPSIAAILYFVRFYAIALLFLSPCFGLGGQTLLATIGRAWRKIRRPPRGQIVSKGKNIELVFFLIAIILGGYFLSQVGFVNFVTGGAIHSYNIGFYSMLTTNESQIKIEFYHHYIPEQDVFSAIWLLNHKVEIVEVFADYESGTHPLSSYGLVPRKLVLPITNTTNPPKGSFVYLGSLNIVNGVIATNTGSFNTSEISFLLDRINLVYSNGNSEIWYVVPAY
jgi:uncharacterized membrane protein